MTGTGTVSGENHKRIFYSGCSATGMKSVAARSRTSAIGSSYGGRAKNESRNEHR